MYKITFFLALVCFGSSLAAPHFSLSIETQLKHIRQLSQSLGLPQVNLRNDDLCLERGCFDAAYDLLNAMNASVDPCKNFYEFACGRWIENHPVPPTSGSASQFEKLIMDILEISEKVLEQPIDENDAKPVNLAKQFYQTCMDEDKIEDDGLDTFHQLINMVGGWELLNPQEWNESEFDWIKMISYVQLYVSRTVAIYPNPKSALLLVDVDYDLKDTESMALYLDQGTFGLPRTVLISPENYTRLISAYETFIVETAQELNSTQTEAELRSMAKEIISLESKLAKISSSDAERYDMERSYNPKTIREYQEETDGIDGDFKIDWLYYFKTTTEASRLEIDENERIIVKELDYINNLIPILKKEMETKRVLANYIVWRMVSVLASESTRNMREIDFRFQQQMVGMLEPELRNLSCYNRAMNTFGMAIGQKYVEASGFEDSGKEKMYEMVDYLREGFRQIVKEADWIRNETKEAALLKEETLTNNLAYPDWLMDKEELEKRYEWLPPGMDQGHFMNKVTTSVYERMYRLNRLRNATDKMEWRMPPGMVDAGYSPTHHNILFPLGILQPPFFGGDRPMHQNFGAIGMVIGHEITHGFDFRGAQFDENGNVRDWWDPETKANYQERAQCMSDQYSKIYIERVEMYVNGAQGVTENIADNGGAREAFVGYMKWVEDNGRELRLPGLEAYSPEQLFFLGFAQPWCLSITDEELIAQILLDNHAPWEFRTNVPLWNMEEFADLYNCPVDPDGMNKPGEEQCQVW